MRVVLIIVFVTCIGCEPAVEQAAPAPPPVEQVQSVDQAPAAEAPAEPVMHGKKIVAVWTGKVTRIRVNRLA